MSRVQLLLAQTDEVYARLRQRLAGLTDDEYFWKPVPDPAPFTTIGWRLVHVADFKVMYHEWAFGPRKLTFPDLAPPATAAGAVARLEEGHQREVRNATWRSVLGLPGEQRDPTAVGLQLHAHPTDRALTRKSRPVVPPSMPQLTIRVGRMRKHSSAKFGNLGLIRSPPVVNSSAVPRTSTARARPGSGESSTRKVTLGLCWTSRHFLVAPKLMPPMSIVSWSRLSQNVTGTTCGWLSRPTVARWPCIWPRRYSISASVKTLMVPPFRCRRWEALRTGYPRRTWTFEQGNRQRSWRAVEVATRCSVSRSYGCIVSSSPSHYRIVQNEPWVCSTLG